MMIYRKMRTFSRTCMPGDYLTMWEDHTLEEDPHSTGGYDETQLDILKGWLMPRGLRLETDDVGILVCEVKS